MSRVFPTKGAGTKKGWHYKFPVIEVTHSSHRAAMHDGAPQQPYNPHIEDIGG